MADGIWDMSFRETLPNAVQGMTPVTCCFGLVRDMMVERSMAIAAPTTSQASVRAAGKGREPWYWSAVFWVAVALAVRLIFLFALGTYRFDSLDDITRTGESGNIAHSIAVGHGFSSPFGGDTGPSTWIAPVYPYLCALTFRLFGLETPSSYIFILVLQSLFSALTVIPLNGIAQRTVGRSAGRVAVVLWALFPWFSKWAVTWVWDMALSALLVAWLFWFALSLEESSVKRWAAFGVFWGFALLVNPALLPLLVVSLVWWAYQVNRWDQNSLKRVALALFCCALTISPWLVRNRVVFGQWIFLRGNFAFEFYLGNYQGSFGRGWGGKGPMMNPAEYARYKSMGEIAYVHWKGQQAMQFVRERPWEFATLTAKRALYFWDGSAMHYRNQIFFYWLPQSFVIFSFLLLPALLITHRVHLPAWPMFFYTLLLYPAPYYLTYSQVRYRHAIEPLMLLLVAKAGVLCFEKVRALFGSAHPRDISSSWGLESR